MPAWSAPRRPTCSAGWTRCGNDNAKGEYYLTDIVGLAVADGRRVVAEEASEAELAGANSRAELAAAGSRDAGAAARGGDGRRGDADRAGDGVLRLGHAGSARMSRIAPNVVFGPGVTVEDGVEIRAFSHLEGCVVRSGAIIGPFARLRPGTEVGRGGACRQFRRAEGGACWRQGAKANHLSYLGDVDGRRAARISAPAPSPAIMTA